MCWGKEETLRRSNGHSEGRNGTEGVEKQDERLGRWGVRQMQKDTEKDRKDTQTQTVGKVKTGSRTMLRVGWVRKGVCMYLCFDKRNFSR